MTNLTPNKLHAIINEKCNEPTISDIIGRDARPVNTLRQPKFEIASERKVRSGWLGDVLDRLSGK